MKISSLVLLAAFVLSGTCLKAKDKKPFVDTITAASILDQSEAAYAMLKIYLDSGKVITSFSNLGAGNKTAKFFRTAYAADGGFNFEYYELGRSNSLYTVNRTNGVTKTWWGLMNRTDTPTNLTMGLAALVGVSSNTASIIPNLLLTADFKKNNIFYGLYNPIGNGTEPINNVECYKVTASSKRYSIFTVWIGKKDFLIHKMETETIVSPAKTAAVERKVDSITKAANLRTHDTLAIKRDSVRQAKRAQFKELSNMITATSGIDTKSFTSKQTYLFFPYTLKKQNPELFKFRPNREIAL